MSLPIFSQLANKCRLLNFTRYVIRKQFLRTARKNEKASSPYIFLRPRKDLLKAAGFALGLSGSTFLVAGVFDYERSKRKIYTFFDWSYDWTYDKTFQNDQSQFQNGQFWTNLTLGEQVIWSIVGLNVAVFLLWRSGLFSHTTMMRYFTNSFSSLTTLRSSMLSSVFSHSNFVHLALNMYVLLQFAPVVLDRFFGVEQFLAFYCTAGVFSSLIGMAHKSLSKNVISANGASGAILALIAYTCTQVPDSKLAIIFLPMFQFDASTAIIFTVIFDSLGLIFRWKLFDHAAHLGGTFFGIWYALFGQELLWHKWRPPVVQFYRKLRFGDKPS